MGSLAPCKGCHIVGSTTYASTDEAIRTLVAAMPDRLKRVPDGETGIRSYFTYWQQTKVIEQAPLIQCRFEMNTTPFAREFTAKQIEEGLAGVRANGFRCGWDDVAIESFDVFKKLKEEGVVPKASKFQLSLPGVVDVVGCFVERQFRPEFEPIYEAGFFKEIRRIQDEIPHDQLAVQLDIPGETANWEGVYLDWWKEGEPKKVVLDDLARLMAQFDQDVEIGLHFCYGDMEHRHWMEPTSLLTVVEMAQGLSGRQVHRLKWIHAPVPLSAMGNLDAYFAPLKNILPQLREEDTELYLGLVHPNDLDGTRKRIQAAKNVVGDDFYFGIGTECGLGRTPTEHLESIFSISTQFTDPVV